MFIHNIMTVLEMHCGVLPTLDNSKTSADGDHYNATAEYACVPPTRYLDGTDRKYINCTQYGNWSEISDDCQRN